MRWPWLLLLAGALSMVQPFAPLLPWQVDAAAEPWRWLTGHLVHGHQQHLLLNLVTLMLFGALLVQPGEGLRAFGCALWCALVITFGLPWLAPEVAPYRGLSGVLHRVVLAQCFARATPECLAVAFLLSEKVCLETFFTEPATIAGMRVVTQAHLLGGLAAIVWTAILLSQASRDRHQRSAGQPDVQQVSIYFTLSLSAAA